MLSSEPTLALLRWAFVVVVFFVLPLVDRGVAQRLRRFSSEAGRIRMLRLSVVSGWCAAVAAVALAWPVDLMRVPSAVDGLFAHPAARAVAGLLVAAAFAFSFGMGLRIATRSAARRRLAESLRPMSFMLPVTRRERAWWVLVSLTAGVCEEIFSRGFLLQFLAGRVAGGLALPLLAACVLSSLLFGVAHVYQGAAGVVRATVAGLLLALLALLTGSLVLPIVLHALADLQTLWMYRPLEDDPERARRLVDGCGPSAA